MRLSWLGTEALTWRDLYVIVKQSPRDSAIYRSVIGEGHEWGLTEHIFAGVFDLLAVANWQRGGDEKAKRPDRLERPGVTKQLDGKLLAKGKAISIEDMNKQLGWTTT